jgi:hypothetical protein
MLVAPRGGDGEMSHLLGLQAAGLALGKAWTFGHPLRV